MFRDVHDTIMPEKRVTSYDITKIQNRNIRKVLPTNTSSFDRKYSCVRGQQYEFKNEMIRACIPYTEMMVLLISICHFSSHLNIFIFGT
jgi:hypothetical protein